MRSYTLFMYNYKDHYLFHPITVLVILGLILRSAHYLFSIILHSAVLMSAHCCQILSSTANQFVALGQCRSAAFASAYDMQSSMTSVCYSIIKVKTFTIYTRLSVILSCLQFFKTSCWSCIQVNFRITSSFQF